MKSMAEIPVITSVEPRQLQLFIDYMTELRGNSTRIAAEEALQLKPYLDALSTKLAADQKATGEKDAEITALTKPGGLSRLFNRFAARTKNTILSGIVITTQDLLNMPEVRKDTTQFGASSFYGASSFTFGFIQTVHNGKNGSTSIPVLSLDTDLMYAVEPFQPVAMLKALQAIATTSNHDMQHHYTSTILNPAIAETAQDASLPGYLYSVRGWADQYFKNAKQDSDPRGYEAFLMFNHARVRRLLEDGPEGDALKESCDAFFKELKRLGKEMTETVSLEAAHEAVDYFGMMAIFSLARSMPLDHPLMERAINSLHDADPDPGAVPEKQKAIIMAAAFPLPPKPGSFKFARQTLANYAAQGVNLLPDGFELPDTFTDKAQNMKLAQDLEALPEQDYASLKKLQLVGIEPWVVHLMSPGQPGTELGDMQERVGRVSRDMIRSSALTAASL